MLIINIGNQTIPVFYYWMAHSGEMNDVSVMVIISRSEHSRTYSILYGE